MAATVAPRKTALNSNKKQLNWPIIAILALVHVMAALAVWRIVWRIANYGLPASLILAVALAASLYVIGTLGITVGYHRGFTHNGYEMKPALKYVLLAFATLEFQGTADVWISDHRRHHKYADVPGLDPHSPFEYANRFKGLLWAHIGWTQCKSPMGDQRVNKDLKDDKHFKWQRRWYIYTPLGALGFVVPWLLAGWDGLLIAGFLRLACAYHVTWSVNSVCHWIGTHAKDSKGQKYLRDDSRNNWLVAVLGLGEGDHSNHHAQPSWAYHGWKWYSPDASKWVIALLERAGLVSGVKKPRYFEFKPIQTQAPERTPIDRQPAKV